jgi:agmatine deiminase
MSSGIMTIALISDVFFGDHPKERLHDRLRTARAAGADLAVLSELALDPWFPVRRDRQGQDAEPVEGERSRTLASAARAIGIGLVGSAVVRDPASSDRRRSTALVYDKRGNLVGTYSKCHLPEEPGYWEASQYEPGDDVPVVFHQFPVPVGIQICSDVYRPSGSEVLAALGAEVIIVPRATEVATFDRWRMIFQAIALTSSVYVASVTRSYGEGKVAMGGPSIVVDPTGRVLVESTEPVVLATMERAVVQRARAAYPGSLPVRADLYARAWAQVAKARGLT